MVQTDPQLGQYSPDMDMPWEKCSKRELTVVYWAIRGYKNEEVAEKLMIESTTVERHIGTLYSKTGLAMVGGSSVRKMMWLAGRDDLQKHLHEDGTLSEEYMSNRYVDMNIIPLYRQQLNDLLKENECLRAELEIYKEKSVVVFDPLELRGRELAIARLVKVGWSNHDIAVTVGCSLPHVSYVCLNLRERLGITNLNRTGRVQLAIKLQQYDFDAVLGKGDMEHD